MKIHRVHAQRQDRVPKDRDPAFDNQGKRADGLLVMARQAELALDLRDAQQVVIDRRGGRPVVDVVARAALHAVIEQHILGHRPAQPRRLGRRGEEALVLGGQGVVVSERDGVVVGEFGGVAADGDRSVPALTEEDYGNRICTGAIQTVRCQSV